MAANDFQYAGIPMGPGGDVSVTNTDSTDLIVGNIVKLDATNVVSGTQPLPGVLLTTTDDYPYGVCIEAIAQTKSGRVRISGRVPVLAQAAITAGARVQCSTGAKAKTCGAAKAQLGQALTAAAADNDFILVQLSIGANA